MLIQPKHSVLKPHGILIINDPALPHEVQIDYLKCVHCGRMWRVEPGSGRRRGFCTRCMQVTCGNPACEACVPEERKLELLEAGKIPSL